MFKHPRNENTKPNAQKRSGAKATDLPLKSSTYSRTRHYV